jgi:hypothetical protein
MLFLLNKERNTMYRNTGSRRTRLFMVVVWMLVLSFFVYPSKNIAAQGYNERLFLPSVVTADDPVLASTSGLVTRKVISLAEQKAAMNFWSREAIAAAHASELLVQAGPATVDEAAVATAAVSGPSSFVAAGAAAADAAAVAQAAFPEDWAALAAAAGLDAPTAVDGTRGVHTSYTLSLAALQRLFPHIWVGRLNYTNASGGTSFCSAAVISGNNIVTAGHCVYETFANPNRFFSNWVFTPAYRAGNAPYGTFPATNCWALNTWIAQVAPYDINSDAPHDVAICKLGNNAAGQTVNNAVGWMGRAVNTSYIGHIHNLGYPQRDYNDTLLASGGAYLRTCVAESFQQTTEVRGMGCFWGRGISGGPWMTGYGIGVVNGWVEGVNSGLSFGSQNMYGARFNNNNIVELCNAAGC